MKEINYQIFDEVSGLPIDGLTDGMIREFAFRFNKSCAEVFQEYKEEIKRVGVKYMIPGGSVGHGKEIKVVPNGAMSACMPVYFDSYKEAVLFLQGEKNV